MFVFNNIFWGIVKWLDKMFGLDFSVSKNYWKEPGYEIGKEHALLKQKVQIFKDAF